MDNVLVQLIPPMIGSLMMPTWVLLVLFLLRSAHGVIKAVAFVGGVTAVRLLQGLLFGTALSTYAGLFGRHALQPVVSGLLLATGLLLWAMGVRRAFRREEPTRSLSTSLPTMHTLISAVTPLRALGVGVLLVVTSLRAWIFTLTALGTIGQAGLHTVQNFAAFLLYVLGAQCALVAPIIIATRSVRWLDRAATWIEEHSRSIVVTISLLVGSYFVWRGLSGLML